MRRPEDPEPNQDADDEAASESGEHIDHSLEEFEDAVDQAEADIKAAREREDAANSSE